MNSSRSFVFFQASLAESLVRVALVVALLTHGPWNFSEAGAIWWATSSRFTEELRWIVGLIEVAAAFSLLSGALLRASALCLVPIFVGGIVEHWSNGFSFRDGGWETPFVYLLLSLSLIVPKPQRSV
jgi:uncharacterized membrane protein YphA (DoxX/SURF4 family)